MKADIAGARIGKLTDKIVNRRHHQMYIDRCGNAVIAQRLTDHRAKGEIGNIVIIHDIKMHHISASIQNALNVITQTGKVRR